MRIAAIHVLTFCLLLPGILIGGCDSGEPEVVMPGEPYQPTLEEQKTLDRKKEALESMNRAQQR